MTAIPSELEAFEGVLIGRLRRRAQRHRRGRLAAGALLVVVALAATAVAGSRDLDQPTVRQQNHIQTLAAARAVFAGVTGGRQRPDVAAARALVTLGNAAGPYAGLTAYIAPTPDGGFCIAFVNAVACGGPPTRAIPAPGLGLGEYAEAPFAFIGIDADFVTRHVVRCGDSSEDVTRNGGGSTYVYVGSAPSVQAGSCVQDLTLDDGTVVTTPL